MSPSNPPDYIGQGLAFPLKINVQGNFQLSGGHNNLEESIEIILSTKIGERVYRPNFGCRLGDLVFAPLNAQTLLMIRIYVEEALLRWEPRIEIDGIFTEPDPLGGRVNIIINYHPKDSTDSRSMVYPFFLNPSA